MAKDRKTLKEKKQATARHQRLVTTDAEGKTSFSYTAGSIPSKRKDIQIDEDSLLTVPSHYINADLGKTVILSFVFLGLLGMAYWYLNMGGQQVLRLH